MTNVNESNAIRCSVAADERRGSESGVQSAIRNELMAICRRVAYYSDIETGVIKKLAWEGILRDMIRLVAKLDSEEEIRNAAAD